MTGASSKSLLSGWQRQVIAGHLTALYGGGLRDLLLRRLESVLEAHHEAMDVGLEAPPMSEKDVVLITYADQFWREGERPLDTLAHFLETRLAGLISTVHLLPFFPYSSDDGFSVIDYRQVNPDFGSWVEIERIRGSLYLMFDMVINHVSAKSAWFRWFLKGKQSYTDYFITVDPQADLSSVVRPRDLPLLTQYETSRGIKHLWTTFSADQVDLNFANPDVLLEILDLLLFYIRHGARMIRLDAIAFLWKEIGTACIHLPQTHRIVKLMRTVVEGVAPWTILITETNVPQEENLSYFGDGQDESHVVYQFALPPLLLHTLTSGNATALTNWAASLNLPTSQVTFFNFTASHDGIGLRPVGGILSEREIGTLVELTKMRGGAVSYRRVGKDERQPYELNINYFDALNDPDEVERQPTRAVGRFLCSQAVMLALSGVPGIYIHSLIGSRNDLEGVQRTGMLRSINREKLHLQPLQDELGDRASLRNRVFDGYSRLLQARTRRAAFSPWGEQEILQLNPSFFALERRSPDREMRILCLHEVSGQDGRLHLPLRHPPTQQPHDILTGERVKLDQLIFHPYQVRWIEI